METIKEMFKLEKCRDFYYEGVSRHTYCVSSSIDALKNVVYESDTESCSHCWEQYEDSCSLTTKILYFETSEEVYEEIYWMISPIKVV